MYDITAVGQATVACVLGFVVARYLYVGKLRSAEIKIEALRDRLELWSQETASYRELERAYAEQEEQVDELEQTIMALLGAVNKHFYPTGVDPIALSRTEPVDVRGFLVPAEVADWADDIGQPCPEHGIPRCQACCEKWNPSDIERTFT